MSISDRAMDHATHPNPEGPSSALRLYRNALQQIGDYAFEEAADLLERAAELDPEYVSTFVSLSSLSSYLYLNYQGSREHRAARAETALAAAKNLAPDLLAVRLAETTFLQKVRNDPRTALNRIAEWPEAHRRSSDGLMTLGSIQRQLGRLGEATETLIQAFHAPRSGAGSTFDKTYKSGLGQELGRTFRAMRRYDEAEAWFARATDLTPKIPRILGERALNLLMRSRGESASGMPTDEARRLLASSEIYNDPELYFCDVLFDLFDATLLPEEQALALYRRIAEKTESGASTAAHSSFDQRPFAFWQEANVRVRLGQVSRARSKVEQVRKEIEAQIASGEDVGPPDLAYLGIAFAFLGDRDRALDWGNRAVEAASGGPFVESTLSELLAINLCLLGESDQALDQLMAQASRTYKGALSRAELRLDPTWAPLRSSPRFAELIAEIDE